MRKILTCALITLTLIGCSPAPAPPQAQPAPPPALGPGWTKEGPINDAQLAGRVLAYLKDQGLAVTGQLYAVKLGQVPEGYDGLILAFAGGSLLLFASDAAHTRLQPVARLDDVAVNTAKLMAFSSDAAQVRIISQMPYKATELHFTIGWDGRQLTVLDRQTTDPTAEYYKRLEAMVQQGDLDGIMKEKGGYLYPDFYAAAYSLPPQILRLAHEKALAAYRAGNLPDALRYMTFGIGQYQPKYGLFDDRKYPVSGQQYQLSPTVLVPIVNDYAFFLAESGRLKEAEPHLVQVIRHAPERAVAYLNLADVLWGLGQRDDARFHYRAYLTLLGTEAAQAPPRVAERLKN